MTATVPSVVEWARVKGHRTRHMWICSDSGAYQYRSLCRKWLCDLTDLVEGEHAKAKCVTCNEWTP